MKRALACSAFAIAAVLVRVDARAAAVTQLAQDVGKALVDAKAPATAVVVVAPLVTDQPAPKGDELALRVASLVAGRIAPTARAHNQPAQLGTARALAGKGGGLVYVQVEIAKGELRATADVYPVMGNSWDRIRNPLPAPTTHTFASQRIDAEVRAFLSPLLLEQAQVHKARHDEGDVLAAACGDVDGDGGMELVLVSRARVAMGRVRAGKVVIEKSEAWSRLAPRAPAPLREPLGSAAIASGVFVGSTDRGGLSIAPDFVLRTALFGLPFAIGDGVACAKPNAGTSGFDGPLVDCASPPSDARAGREAKERDLANVKLEAPSARFDAFAMASFTTRDGGAPKSVVAAREPNGKLRVRIGDAAPRVLEGAGAQIAVGDLDQDGVPELVTTLDVRDATGAAEDAITISTLGANEIKTRVRIAAPAGVRALTTCPPEERGAPALVAVVGGEVWIVR